MKANPMQHPIMCAHLRELLDALIAQGAQIERVETSWSKADLVVVLSQGLSPDLAKAEAKARGLEFWANNDAHYSIEYGVFCNEHKQGLSWPQSMASIQVL